jgi:hypothetical protein
MNQPDFNPLVDRSRANAAASGRFFRSNQWRILLAALAPTDEWGWAKRLTKRRVVSIVISDRLFIFERVMVQIEQVSVQTAACRFPMR